MAKRKKTAERFMVRQGDVLLIRDDALKAGKEIAAEGGRVILATGETSFHCHAVDAKKAKLYELARQETNVLAAIDRRSVLGRLVLGCIVSNVLRRRMRAYTG